jgi:hypothetical protein
MASIENGKRIYSQLEPCNMPGGYCASFISKTYDEPVVIDEWQLVPEVQGAVKRAVDIDSRAGRFLLTGSLSADLTTAGWARRSICLWCGSSQRSSPVHDRRPNRSPPDLLDLGTYSPLRIRVNQERCTLWNVRRKTQIPQRLIKTTFS